MKDKNRMGCARFVILPECAGKNKSQRVRTMKMAYKILVKKRQEK
jgi:hypothetical protein